MPNTVREMICIACPLGCGLKAELSESGEILSVTGNSCKRGDSYARTEITNPTRSFTSTVKLTGGTRPVVSVKSKAPVPKGKMADIAEVLKSVTLPAPVQIGDIALPDAVGTGVDIVVTDRVSAA
ncbi:MAG: DUF1667 domain-containing protein [Oscillospiraceae bacterium]|jgi:CxxC motif-containing protein|nr:DUF1667 domain-containing protein [Oscillospiraceae bacterium]